MSNITTITELGDSITSELVNGKHLRELKYILEEYDGHDYNTYAMHMIEDGEYHKKTAYINDSIEIVVITWGEHCSTKIHDHPRTGCLMRVLENSICEDIFGNIGGKPQLSETTILEKNNISYTRGNIRLHRIKNVTTQVSISIHVYGTPSYKAKNYN
jgi:predicted metal-dependent enzyme (double-stranded beta helix superfamily)